jgi:hypothetical protein
MHPQISICEWKYRLKESDVTASRLTADSCSLRVIITSHIANACLSIDMNASRKFEREITFEALKIRLSSYDDLQCRCRLIT